MKLQLGKMKTKDLAAWFGVSVGRFHNASPQFYEKLSHFCEYEKVYGGVIINDIYQDTYERNFDARTELLVIDEVLRCAKENDSLGTISGMARLFMLQNYFTSERTAKRIISKILVKLFGITKDDDSYGEIGSRDYIWGIKLDDYDHYRLMTGDEVILFDQIITDFYSRSPDIIKKAALLADAVYQGEMSPEEFFGLMQADEHDYLSFRSCIRRFLEKTGHIIARTTRFQIFITYLESYREKLKAILKEN